MSRGNDSYLTSVCDKVRVLIIGLKPVYSLYSLKGKNYTT